MLTSLSPADAVKLVLSTIGAAAGPDRAQAEEQAEQLAAELEGSQPALRQAGAYIVNTPGVSLAGYLHLLRAPAGGSPEAGGAVARVWALTCPRIEHTSPLAMRALRVLACYAPEDLPRSVLNGLQDAEENALDGALDRLVSYGVIDRSPDGLLVRVHRQVQAVIVAGLTEDEHSACQATAAALLRAALPSDSGHPSSWPVYASLLAHAHAVLAPDSPAMGSVIEYLHDRGEYRTALSLQHRRHAVTLDTLGPEHADTLTAHADLASLVGATGDIAEARTRLTELEPTIERLLGPDHPTTLDVRVNLASLVGSAGNATEARDRSTALIPMLERTLGPEHSITLNARANLVVWTGEAGAPATETRDRFTALIPVLERALGREHLTTLNARVNLARWSGESGDPADARNRFTALLPLVERARGPEHPAALEVRGALADWVGEAGDAPGARDRSATLVPVLEQVMGPEHPATLGTRFSLARWTGEAGDAAGARYRFTMLIPVLKRVLGHEHLSTLNGRLHLAVRMSEAGDPAGGMDQLAVLVPVVERVLGPEHPTTLAARFSFASLTGQTGSTVDARDQLAVLVPVIERLLGPEHPDTLAARSEHAHWAEYARRSSWRRWFRRR
ncbi:tetratricopeptide repeat protein [Streptosporangium sp. NPDC002524]|uniref:tetratricopeptide repeat protein n=1 Tax=Streptosporangium sp. NPDC002524 TaxID=3154537 RepID=UPI003325EFD5